MSRPKRPDRVLLFRNHRGDWYWTLKSAHNGLIIGAASEGYTERRGCIRNLERVTGGKVAIGHFTSHSGYGVLQR